MNENLVELPSRAPWWGWGSAREPLTPTVRDLLEHEFGIATSAPEREPVPLQDIRLTDSALTEDDLARLRGAGAEVLTDTASRVAHAGGKSYADLYRRRSGDCAAAPDAVVCPQSAQAVADLLAACAQLSVAVVPYGGGTSVVGGVEPLRGSHRAVISLDLRALDQMVSLNLIDRTATFQAGMRGPQIEAALQPNALTLGHYPQSHQQATIGGYVATRSAGQASTGYGRSDDLVQRLTLATPTGTMVLGGAPASAAGPRLLDLLIGSEGTLGVITEVTMRVTSAPVHKRYAAWAFPSFEAATTAIRTVAQHCGPGELPAVCRVSDAEETRVSLAMGGSKASVLGRYLGLRGVPSPAMGIFVWEGDKEDTGFGKHRCESIFGAHEGVRLGPLPAKAWEHGRFNAPYLRDTLMSHGVFVETLETATTWSRLLPTYEAVRSSLQRALGERSSVQCHVSHVYPDGASLYFTYVAKEEPDPIEQWQRAKYAASHAIVAQQATITHHHAVGRDHLPYLAAEIGDTGIEVLRAVKNVLDPTGIMNPGKLMGPA